MPVVKQGNPQDTSTWGIIANDNEYTAALQWSASRANVESRRARQEIMERLFACPAHPATLEALEAIKARLLNGPA